MRLTIVSFNDTIVMLYMITKTEGVRTMKRLPSHDEFLAMKSKNTKKITVFEKTQTMVDVTTGEIMSKTQESINRISKEPDFIKVYYETMLAFNQIHGVPISFVLSLSKFLEWTNEGKPMCVTINRRVKDILQEDCEVKSAQISRYITISVESGLLFRTKYRGVYEVNPFMIAKGKWISIRELQCKFNFVNGKWIREIENETQEDNEVDPSEVQPNADNMTSGNMAG